MLSRLTALGSLLPCTAVPFVCVARAQPADVVGGWEPSAARLEPAAPPADFVVERRGSVHWVYPPQATEHVRELQRIQARRWPELLEELGAVDGGPLEIRVARNPAEMAAMGPPAHPPPPYAIGVAYPRHSLVLVSLTAPRSGRVGEATSVLVHELSHVALHRASGGAPLPRWFVEGVAIHQAGEASFARTRLLWGATVAGRLLPLEDLERRFPSEPGVVDLAYAQAADFVRFLLDEEPGRLRSLLAAVRAGRSFEHAIREATGRDPDTLQRDWHGALRMRFTALPLVVTGTSLWGAAALLLVWAHLARRRRQRATLARWEREEREERAHAPAEPLLGPSLLVEPTPPREPGIPTVEYEGRSHTLH